MTQPLPELPVFMSSTSSIWYGPNIDSVEGRAIGRYADFLSQPGHDKKEEDYVGLLSPLLVHPPHWNQPQSWPEPLIK